MKPDYSFQDRCSLAVEQARKDGIQRLLIAAPTGSGKGNMIKDLAEAELEDGGRPIVYSERKVIREQLSNRLMDFGIKHGIRAAGYRPDLAAAAQVSSIHTERARSLKESHPWEVHEATLALFDEAHLQKATTAQKLIKIHQDQGAMIVGFTATPVGLGHLYDQLAVLIQNSELRKLGVIVQCEVFCPSEIDMEGVAVGNDGEYVQGQMQKRFEGVKHEVLGNVFEHYNILNPDRRPAVLFSPGVPESRWFVEEFNKKGIAAAHLDAETPEDERLSIFAQHKAGDIKVLSSYGILSVGWDAPWASHGILCRPCNAPSTFIQLVGRILRSSPGKEKAVLQDHVGAWWRPGLGSPNADRDWELDGNDRAIVRTAKEKRQDPEEKEPGCCPKCGKILNVVPRGGFVCTCGHVFKRSVRKVFQKNGRLVRKQGNTTKKKTAKNDSQYYISAIYAAIHSGRSVSFVYWLANKMKQQATGDPHAMIHRDNIKSLPTYTKRSPEWNQDASWVFSFLVRKKWRK